MSARVKREEAVFESVYGVLVDDEGVLLEVSVASRNGGPPQGPPRGSSEVWKEIFLIRKCRLKPLEGDFLLNIRKASLKRLKLVRASQVA